ncbi:MAG: hypothetical protein NUV53_03540 [Patescibacteria group bacterium]|nr:hypothetical protein [Patescibacteria group bacterium]
MMYDAIKRFHEQFEFQPKIENAKELEKFRRIKKSNSPHQWSVGFVVAGMGGSHLAADLLRAIHPEYDILIHSDYGLPKGDIKNRLIIISSYSGNTEEAISAFEEARKRKLPCAAIATGGKLLEYAKKSGVPYVQLPDLGLEPRVALGLSLLALFALVGARTALRTASKLSHILRPSVYESRGKKFSTVFLGKVPIIYASARNVHIAYNWKIKFNETGKIPAYMNVIPELNHNEINGFDVSESTQALSRHFHFLFITDEFDDARVQKRMRILKRLYRARKLQVTETALKGKSLLERAIISLILADWTAYYTALGHGGSPDGVPIVDEFKKLMERSDR